MAEASSRLRHGSGSPSRAGLTPEQVDKLITDAKVALNGSVDVIRNTLEFKIYESQEYWKAISTINKCYSKFKRDCHKNVRNEIILHMVETDSVSNVAFILNEQLTEGLTTFKTDKEFKTGYFRSMIFTTLHIFNGFAEESVEFTEAAVKKSCLLIDCIKTLLDNFKLLHFRNQLNKESLEILFLCLTLSYNLVMYDDFNTISCVRDRSLLKSVRPYVYSADRYKTLSFMFMLYVSNEAELCSDPVVIGELLDHLIEAKNSPNKISGNFTCKELMRALEKLTSLDVDRQLLYDIGIVDKMTELLFSKDVEQMQSSLGILTHLAFDVDKKIAKEIHDKVHNFIQEKMIRHADPNIQKAAVCLNWVLEEKLSLFEGQACQSSDPRVFRRSASRVAPAEGEQSLNGGAMGTIPVPAGTHIMISYQWDNQAKVRKMKMYLEEKGFSVWYDEDKMEMNLLDSMAAAVESAWVILICYSRKYKFSKNCRLEAEYASKLKVPVIPVQMEDYDPDGWLGLLIGRLLFHKFWDNVTPEAYAQLCGALKTLKRRLHVGGPDTLVTEPTIRPMTATVTTVTQVPTMGDSVASFRSHADTTLFGQDLTFLANWGECELDDWFKRNSLNRELFGVKTGKDLRLLMRMHKESPNSFYKYMMKRLSLTEISTFTEAMESLVFSQRLDTLPRVNFQM